MSKNKAKSNFSVRKLIYNDKYLIIFSIIAAVVLWIIASINLSPETTKTVKVPLNVDFSNSAISQLGLKYYGDQSIDVDVTINCKKYLAKDITADDIILSLQANSVTTNGIIEVPISVEASRDDFTIKSYYPTTYKAYFDIEETKSMNIKVKLQNENVIADGYVMGIPVLSVEKAKLTGPKTYVSQVEKVVATVNVDENISKTKSYTVTAEAVDSSGKKVSYVNVNTGKEKLTVTIPVLKEEKLGVAVRFDNVPEGVDTSKFSISYSRETVNAGVLEEANLTEANIGSIDMSELKPGRNEFTFDISNLESLVVLDNIKEISVMVIVPKDYSTKQVSVSRSNIDILNIPDGYSAYISYIDFTAATVVGKSDDIEKIKVADLHMNVDLSLYAEDLEEGSKMIPVTISPVNEKCWVFGDYNAKVYINKK